MPTWPTSLPGNLNADDYAEVRQDGALRSAMDAGPEFVRQRYSATPVRIRGSLIISDVQVATLDDFFFDDCTQGSTPFDWIHPRTGAAATVRFMAPPEYQALSNDLYQVSLSLQIDP